MSLKDMLQGVEANVAKVGLPVALLSSYIQLFYIF